jgi:glyoxylase I family protein
VDPDWPAAAEHFGFHHLALNVQDVEVAATWYRDVLGFEPLARYQNDDFERAVLRHPGSGAVLGLTRHRADVASEPFDERRAGLDHVAFGIGPSDDLEGWVRRLDSLGVAHSGIQAGAIPGSTLLVFRDPDGVQLEVYAPPG